MTRFMLAFIVLLAQISRHAAFARQTFSRGVNKRPLPCVSLALPTGLASLTAASGQTARRTKAQLAELTDAR